MNGIRDVPHDSIFIFDGIYAGRFFDKWGWRRSHFKEAESPIYVNLHRASSAGTVRGGTESAILAAVCCTIGA